MEPKDSFPFSQQPYTLLSPEPDESSLRPHILLKVTFNIILHLSLNLPICLFPSSLPNQTLCVIMSHALHMPHPVLFRAIWSNWR
jgi:hypothetical protein